MPLRKAVGIHALGFQSYAATEMIKRHATPSFPAPPFLVEEISAEYQHALAVVDAAVRFIEARAEVDAASDAEPVGDDERMALAYEVQNSTEAKLRALERGEVTK